MQTIEYRALGKPVCKENWEIHNDCPMSNFDNVVQKFYDGSAKAYYWNSLDEIHADDIITYEGIVENYLDVRHIECSHEETDDSENGCMLYEFYENGVLLRLI